MANEDRVREFYDCIERKEVLLLERLLTDDFRFEGASPKPLSKAEFLPVMAALLRAFPDWRFNLAGVTARGDEVDALHRITATHTGFLELPQLGVRDLAPTNRAVRLPPEQVVFTCRDGQIAAMQVKPRSGGGIAGILEQIGAKVAEPAR